VSRRKPGKRSEFGATAIARTALLRYRLGRGVIKCGGVIVVAWVGRGRKRRAKRVLEAIPRLVVGGGAKGVLEGKERVVVNLEVLGNVGGNGVVEHWRSG
jgi:hypothetical protein